MSRYYTVTELALKTGLHRQTVYMKVKKEYEKGSDLVRKDKDGYRASEKLFQKYLIEKNVEDTEAEEVKLQKDLQAVEQLKQAYSDMLDKYSEEVQRYREDNKALYERIAELTANEAKITALLQAPRPEEGKLQEELARLQEENKRLNSAIEASKSISDEVGHKTEEKPAEALKTPYMDQFILTLSLSVFVVVVIFIVLVLS